MLWSRALLIMSVEIVMGAMFGRVLIPYFRKLKTGKLDACIGDRFKQDGSEPKFGGVVIALSLAVGAMIGLGGINGGLGSDSGFYVRKTAAALIMSGMLMLLGCCEDYLKDVRKSNAGLKISVKLTVEFAICLCFLISLRAFCGDYSTEMLLPFRLGYINFSFLYYPLVALGMTAVINAVKLHDCFGGDTQSSADGLCAVSVIVYSLFFAVYGNIMGNEALSMTGYVCAAAVGGFLVWGISPSKLYLGESGALLLGGVVSSLAVVSKLHLLVFITGLGFAADGVCSLIQYIVYKSRKKLAFKGNSLHAHFKEKGYSDYKIMLIFTCINAVGGAVGIAFAIYSTKL